MAQLGAQPGAEVVNMRKAYGSALVNVGRTHPDVVVLSADSVYQVSAKVIVNANTTLTYDIVRYARLWLRAQRATKQATA